MSAPPAVHPQIQALIAEQTARKSADGPPDLAALRAGYLETALRLGGAREEVAECREIVIAERVGARAYLPVQAAEPRGCVVWVHGGGWLMGDLDGFDNVCRALTNAAGHVVVSVDYRLAPEHPFPAPLDDVLCATEWALGHGAEQLGYDPGRVILGGDSAGGNLAAVAARHHGPALRGQLLVYPATDALMDTPSYHDRVGEPMLRADEMAACWAAYLGDHDRADPDASPLRAPDLSGCPAAVIAVAGADVLRDDGVRYAEALKAAGVAADLVEYSDMVHGFLRWGGVVDRAGECVRMLGAAARARLAG